jgi:nucleotide-binding universal stress UspA family protein
LKAVKRALELAEKEGAKVTLMSVGYYFGDGFDDLAPNIQDKLEDQAKDAMKKAKEIFDKKGIAVETVVEMGIVPANNIIRKSKEGKFDLILMGSTGLTGLSRALMGSTASKVVQYAPCSVNIIR